MIISSGVSESSVRRRGGRGAAGGRVSPGASSFDRFTECVESLIFSMAQITLLKIFYIFTFYLAECTTIFYLRVDPTTTLSLFFYKVQCFIPPVAGGPCYVYTCWCVCNVPMLERAASLRDYSQRRLGLHLKVNID
ncbi:hypothetical protein B5X24_HaOG205522 [Helicoverpa armigera]|nr:hypothetical protein B5X24_HaOG205522 [Helicoverpa armigera]